MYYTFPLIFGGDTIVEKYLDGSLNPKNVVDVISYNLKFYREHPDYFHPEGLLTFHGGQGSGKTLSCVSYVLRVMEDYPKAILVSNVLIKEYPFNAMYECRTKVINEVEHTFISYKSIRTKKRLKTVDIYYQDGKNYCNIIDYPQNDGYELPLVIEYDGLDCIKMLVNGEYGILYVIDEIHLEFNSLESKNVPIEVMIEVSQQRKQRKHIVGTAQVYGRMAKQLREQIKHAVLCTNILKVLQINLLIDGDKSEEMDGKLETESVKRYFWFHSPKLYNQYDTYAKMKRYRKEWQGRKIS